MDESLLLLQKAIADQDLQLAKQLIVKLEEKLARNIFLVKRLEHDNKIFKTFLNNTILDLESSNKELQLLKKRELAQKDELIRTAQYHLDQIANEISSGMAFIDTQLNYQLANASYLKWVEQDFTEVKGKSIIKVLGKIRYEELEFAITKALQGERVDFETQFALTRGEVIHIQASYIPSYNKDKVINGVYIFEQDITDLKEKKQQLQYKNDELNEYIESNLQLENFAHIASHDLKAPLNNIRNFSTLLHQTAFDKLDENEKKFLNFINIGADNLQNTIAALFNFSLASNKKIQKVHFSILEVLKGLIKDLYSTIKQSNAKIVVKSLPNEMFADQILIRQLFQNLILNAIKFTNPDTTPHIEIDSREDEQYWYFEIKDNGIGIPVEFKDKIFMLFKRLNTQNKFEGSGIGLATCKKIVELHQGSIWVENNENGGSIFKFNIQKIDA